MSKLLLYFYFPGSGDSTIDLRVFGPKPLTVRHIDTLLAYCHVAQRALASAAPCAPQETNARADGPGGMSHDEG